ncbi:MAG: tRNA pseudouridine(38-40) synthase TruA [Helicobacter sp.]|nr:tRNA pseudouridine(38-40) synthase TruA [Helicobacter sp.]
MQNSSSPCPNLVATIAYDGSAFYGSQSQPNRPSVLGSLRNAFACCGLFGKILCASRTDKGVHALRNVVSIPLPYAPKNLDVLRAQLNKYLLPHICVVSLRIAPSGFHARFDAKARLYRYIIAPQKPNVFQSRYVHFHDVRDFGRIAHVIRIFEGIHDFRFFAKQSEKNTICGMHKAHAFWWNRYVVLSFLARGFLHSQIRFIVQALLLYDSGRLGLIELHEQLGATKRHTCALAPPNGLYLCRVYY